MTPISRGAVQLTYQGITVSGSEHPNQDVWAVEGVTGWVIDGASRPMSPAGAVEGYVTGLSNALTASIRQTPEAPLDTVLEAAITATRTGTASATIAMARATPAGFDWLVLGDATIWLDTTTAITDDRLSHIATCERTRRAHIRTLHGPGEAYQKATAELLAVEDAHRNRPGGFWVCGDTPTAARQAITGHTTSTTIVLASDGLDGHHGPDATSLFHDDLPAEVARLRSLIRGGVDDITVVRFARGGSWLEAP